jgi:hypothetical protein
MFRDLKEYQEIQNLYESQVYLSEEEENELFDIVESFDLTDEELEYFVENLEEFSADQDLQEIKNIRGTLNTLSRLKGGKFGGGMKTGIDLTKSAKRANLKNLMGRKPFDPIKPKFAGPVNLGKFTSIKDKLKTNAKRLAVAGGGVGTIALARQLGKGGAVEQEKKKIEDKVKGNTITKVKSVTAGASDDAIKKGIEDAKKTGIPNNTAVQGGAMSQKAREDAAFNRGERKARKDLKDPTLNDNMKKKTDPPKATDTKSQTSTTTTTTPQKKMSSIEKKNRARFGDERVDMLKAKNKDFQAMKKGKMTKQEFVDKYPKSITAQRQNKLRDHTEWDAYDIVLEYLHSSGQVATIEEANYVMTEMDTKTIQEIIKDVTIDEKFNINKVRVIPALLKGGAAVAGTKMIASKLGQSSVQPVTPPTVTTPNITPNITPEAQPGDGIPGRKPGESLSDYKKRRNTSIQQQIKNIP